jgi:hypothetical protein
MQRDLDRALPVRRTGLVPVVRASAADDKLNYETARGGDLKDAPQNAVPVQVADP